MRALVCLFIFILALVSPTFASAQPLRIVTEPWGPYVYQDGTALAGIDYEIANEVFNRLGVQVQWQFLPWKRCLMMIEEGQADAVLDIFRTPTRERQLIYANEALSSVEFVLYEANERPQPAARLKSLQGLRVGIAPGFLYGPVFEGSQAQKEPAPNLEANFGKLLLGRVDLVIGDRRQGRFALRQTGLEGRIREIPGTLHSDVLYLALRRTGELAALAERFASTLQAFKREPAYRELLKRYEH